MIDALLAGVALVDVDRAHLLAAARSPHRLRSADAIHLATALALDVDLLATYDREIAEAAERESLGAFAPDE